MNKVLRTDSGMKLTIYSIKPAADNLDEMIVTLLADNNTASGTDIANAALGPLRMLFGEYSDEFPTISFDIRGSERFGELMYLIALEVEPYGIKLWYAPMTLDYMKTSQCHVCNSING